MGEEYSKTKRDTSSKILIQELKLNKERERSLCKGYKNRSKSSKKREKKSVRELKKKSSKLYNIKVL